MRLAKDAFSLMDKSALDFHVRSMPLAGRFPRICSPRQERAYGRDRGGPSIPNIAKTRFGDPGQEAFSRRARPSSPLRSNASI
jgi:hypothetical protein